MPKAGTITSAANPLLKDVRRAVARGGLTDRGLCVAETFHLFEEALRSECVVETVLVAESAAARVPPGVPVQLVPDSLLEKIAGTETSPGVIALVEPHTWTIADLFHGQPLIVVLDGVQDPGNAGTIVRAAEAFAATGVVFLKGSVSPFNPKTLRAAAGSLFRVPFVHGMESAPALAALQQNGVALFAAVQDGRALAQADLARPCALIIGSEAHGVSAALRGAADNISIPTQGVESLNAAMAAAILLYEARRQRTHAR